jgi:DNA (cytosine-5)-methyltransferase 1
MRGALMANLKLKWGLDFNPDACATLVANFQGVRVFKKWVHMFVALPDPLKQLVVDILHLSPPCQVFSPLHTCPGKDDEMNFASLFGVLELIKKARPRIVTLEQTFGIVHLKKFRNAFNQLVRMFTDNGYSTSWQVVEFERFGLSQSRKRLIIVAAGYVIRSSPFPRFRI